MNTHESNHPLINRTIRLVWTMTEELVSYLEGRAGSHLREVAVYDENSWEIMYLREDLDKQIAQERIEQIYTGVKAGLGPQELEHEVGERYATLQVREDAVLLNLPWDRSEGSFVGLEPGAASQLMGFIDECLKHGYRNTIRFSSPSSTN